MKVVVNADDFGLSSSVNGAILESFEKGWISSTTIMANMPGFEEGCVLAHERGVADRIGLHFNLTSGEPMTEELKRSRTFCDAEGNLNLSVKHGMLLTRTDRELLKAELAAQWRRLFDNGLTPIHLDTHHHRHYSWAVMGVVIEMSRSLGIRTVRPARWGASVGRGAVRSLYSKMLNGRLRRARLLTTRFMVRFKDDMMALRGSPDPFEIMVHPTRAYDGTVRNYDEGDLLCDFVGNLPYSDSFRSYRSLLDSSG